MAKRKIGKKDLDLSKEQHNEIHKMLTKQLEVHLWTLPEIKELANLQPVKIIYQN